MTCPRCKCPECAKVELNAVLSRRVARETETYGIGPAITNDPPVVEAHNARVLADIRERERWSDTFGGPRPRRFLLPRELGKPPVDPDAEQLAADVVREQVRVAG